jgi:hypothetical protein
MNLNATHLLIVTVCTLAAVVALALGTDSEVGKNLDVLDGLMGAFLIEVGAIAGVSKSG